MSDTIRNLGIVAHVDAGKTTLSEQLLLLGGAIRSAGRVDEGLSTMDFLPQEQERGITIRAGVASFPWKDARINFVDTPGHIDFSLEVERSLRVLDGAIAVFCGVRGVEPRSRAVWSLADRFHVPRIAWINKLDQVGADFAGTVLEIEDAFGICALPVDWPVVRDGTVVGSVDLVRWKAREVRDWKRRVLPEVPADWLAEATAARERLLEEASRHDEDLTRQILTSTPEPASISGAVARGCREGRILPICGGAAVRGWNCAAVLDAAVEFLPGPDWRTDWEGHPGIALAFQTGRGSDGSRLALVRSFSGTFSPGDEVRAGGHGTTVIETVQRVFAEDLLPLDSAEAGDIFAVGLRHPLKPGDTICKGVEWTPIEPLPGPRMVLEIALEAPDREQHDLLRKGLEELGEEEAGMDWLEEPTTGRFHLRGQGELQLEVATDRLRDEFGAEFKTGGIHVRKRERLAGPSGPTPDSVEWIGHRLQLSARIDPIEAGLEVVWEVPIPEELGAAIQAGFREAAVHGAGAHGGLDGVRFTVESATWSEGAPALLGKRLADHLGPELIHGAGVVTMVPAVLVEILTPEEHLGAILQALQARGVDIQAVDTQRNGAVVRGISPLEPLIGCATLCRSLSKGLALLSLEPGGWTVEPA
jgi:elongation factor G